MSPAGDAPPPSGTPLDLHLTSGDLHAEWFGAERGRLVVCIPGLSANLRGFDFIAERIADPAHRILTLDLRGRGQSQVTGPGSYGWVHHAEDVLAIADALGASRFDVVGQSMGAFVALEIARLAPQRLGSVVLIDACGLPDPTTVPLIRAAVERLGTVYPSVEIYLDAVQRLGTIRPWSPYWERYFRYELVPVEGGGVRARSDRAAVLEDAAYGEEHDPRTLWSYVTMPTLLLRATQELFDGAGFIVPAAERDAFLAAVPSASLVEVDANHYGINTHPASSEAIAVFLR
ncbi:MAG TPA: alpha/beta fold hydrolase [Candidatus Sulfotelmatobacter sp.]|nr:alpha/beta fold hydrolase [Candidatus Sulfotelmatobacter sp.]